MARSDVWLLTRQLADALARTPEVERFRTTEEALLADPEAVRLVRRHGELRRRVASAGLLAPAERARVVREFLAVEAQYRNHPLIVAHQEARAELDRLVARISDILNFAVTGRLRPGGGAGCPGGCGRLGSP
ncbi:YlbF family regulator [Caldinitratiruptor microaerophilus]|uniref:YlbF family regulator n=1 Tax=Caldinitratiruptor microaerophilus TaxID=671077 RepID=A0AA35CLZ2_9FIRM|nr:YlbF family regulator [Caldinitratiruptor microaerophilus]BDG59997.1 hypothetical protein caldi_10870 [Caldinitratiruptor microaerophilus]